MVVREFMQGLGSSFEARDPVEYLRNIQRMKGEWFNQQGRTNYVRNNCAVGRIIEFTDLYGAGLPRLVADTLVCT